MNPGIVGLFAVTNIDDILILSLFFAQGAGRHGSARRIVIGQYLGFSAILRDASGYTLRCLSCGHFAALVAPGNGGVRPVGCLLCGKAYDDVAEVVDAYGMGSFYEAISEGGEPPAYECAECSTGQACVVPTQTADEPDGQVLLCLLGAHALEGMCDFCQRAADFALLDIRYARL
ncbi:MULTISPECIES: hypothetical protein [Streptomyces]|uniref:Uncharacterized protein n=1 Tax=Streptomyces canarius TaxID=285453 RepID=A0ABQ3DEL4_9ACTN|nr:hypothetical protein [Streptomyces canarius]GHA76222.1 hypothetical protein GCM10010345_92820 [Streptomyces canarius]